MKLEFDFSDIPENAIPGIALGIQVFYDETGKAFYAYECKGESTKVEYVGILEVVKQRVIDSD